MGASGPGVPPCCVGEFGGVPGIGFVVESVGVAHVEQPVDVGLHAENQFRITDVAAQIGGHGGRRLEQIGKQIPISLQQRVVRFEDVEMHRAVVGIDGGLHGIADVVELADSFQTDFGRIGMDDRKSCSRR